MLHGSSPRRVVGARDDDWNRARVSALDDRAKDVWIGRSDEYGARLRPSARCLGADLRRNSFQFPPVERADGLIQRRIFVIGEQNDSLTPTPLASRRPGLLHVEVSLDRRSQRGSSNGFST